VVAEQVFPTHVGMDLVEMQIFAWLRCFPHTRGDGPGGSAKKNIQNTFSPHTWGWTISAPESSETSIVFPTHVGMDLSCALLIAAINSFPHTRGDGPKLDKTGDGSSTFSPHTWGWTRRWGCQRNFGRVFPTHVGMDLLVLVLYNLHQGFPHTRGDGPRDNNFYAFGKKFSPHTWGWTHGGSRGSLGLDVFPTHVGMDLRAMQKNMYP